MADIKTAVTAEVQKVEQEALTDVELTGAQVGTQVTSFVAKHNFWFLGGAFVLGFLVGHAL